MALPTEKPGGFTYADYKRWHGDARWEIVHGVPYAMSPAPSPRHQHIVLHLAAYFLDAVAHTDCSVFAAPVDVVLRRTEERHTPSDKASDDADTVVQPDVVLLCDRSRITADALVGPPDLVVEILSPGTGFRDHTTKFELYENSGVREYRIINPDTRVVEIYVRADSDRDRGRFDKPRWYRDPGVVQSDEFDREIDLSGIWPID